MNKKIIFLKKNKRRERKKKKKKRFTTYNHTRCTGDYIGPRKSPSNIDKKLISYITRRDAFTMKTGPGAGLWISSKGLGEPGGEGSFC